MPAIIRRNSCWKSPEFQGNTGGMLAIIPADSSGIPVESAWNLHGIPGLFLLGMYLEFPYLQENVISRIQTKSGDIELTCRSSLTPKYLSFSAPYSTKTEETFTSKNLF